MARNRLATKAINEDAGTVTVKFSDERTVSLSITDLNGVTAKRSALHGMSQKLGDSFAGADTVDEAYDACAATAQNLRDGNWATRGVGGTGTSILVEALFEATKHEGRTLEQCQELMAEMSDDQKKGLRAVPQIKAHMDRITAERATKRAEASAKAAGSQPLDLSAILGGGAEA